MLASRHLLLIFLLLGLGTPADGGRGLSRLAARPRSPKDGERAPEVAAPDSDFQASLQQLRLAPDGGASALRAVLAYLERVRERPRDRRARSVCLWDPELRSSAPSAPSAVVQCLRAAGFSRVEKDARGTPFLLMRRTAPQRIRQLIALTARQLDEAEAHGPDSAMGEAAAGGAVASARSAVGGGKPMRPSRKPALTDEAEGGGAEDEDDRPEQDPGQKALVQQISAMVTGLISELESGEPAVFNSTKRIGNPTNDTKGQPPVHFRVYRSPSFPGFPPGGGLPFMPPGGLPPGMGGPEPDEDGEVPVLERRLRAAALSQEALDVAERELKRLRRMSPMHSECVHARHPRAHPHPSPSL